jgi:hypothetical protein
MDAEAVNARLLLVAQGLIELVEGWPDGLRRLQHVAKSLLHGVEPAGRRQRLLSGRATHLQEVRGLRGSIIERVELKKVAEKKQEESEKRNR